MHAVPVHSLDNSDRGQWAPRLSARLRIDEQRTATPAVRPRLQNDERPGPLESDHASLLKR